MQEIICLLDMSGSMVSRAQDAVAGYNKFIEEQRKIGPANITVIWFDGRARLGYCGPLDQAPLIAEWPKGGNTALYDAIGYAIDVTAHHFMVSRPSKVILAIQTDGEDNVSVKHSPASIKALIEEHERAYGWSVIYLGAGLHEQVHRVASTLGIRAHNTVAYNEEFTFQGMEQYSMAVSKARG